MPDGSENNVGDASGRTPCEHVAAGPGPHPDGGAGGRDQDDIERRIANIRRMLRAALTGS